MSVVDPPNTKLNTKTLQATLKNELAKARAELGWDKQPEARELTELHNNLESIERITL